MGKKGKGKAFLLGLHVLFKFTFSIWFVSEGVPPLLDHARCIVLDPILVGFQHWMMSELLKPSIPPNHGSCVAAAIFVARFVFVVPRSNVRRAKYPRLDGLADAHVGTDISESVEIRDFGMSLFPHGVVIIIK